MQRKGGKQKGGGGGGGFRLKPHIEVRFKWMLFPIGIFQSLIFSLREHSKKKFDNASSRSLLQQPYQRFDGEIRHRSDGVRSRKGRRRRSTKKVDEDTVDSPQLEAFEGASRKSSSSSFKRRQLMKRIHNERDEFDEEEVLQDVRKDRRQLAPFYSETPTGLEFT